MAVKQHPTRDDLVTEAIEKYHFRPRMIAESIEAYLALLIAHVQSHDIAAAFELRVGRRQPDWTKENIAAFIEHTRKLGGPSPAFDPGLHAFAMMETAGHRATPEALRLLALGGVAFMQQQRRENPTGPLLVMVNVLLTDGRIKHTAVHPDERLALLTAMAKSEPVFGFYLVFDAWLHHVVSDPTGTRQSSAGKRDCIMAQVRTRDERYTIVRSYEVRDGKVVFDDPPPPDITDDDYRNGRDPYAEVFVSVPPTDRVQ